MSQRKRPSADLPTILLHWGMVATLLVSLATGLRIGADDPDDGIARAVSSILPQGDVIAVHVWSATALLALTTAYVVFLLRSRLASRVTLDRQRRAALLGGGERFWASLNVAIYWLAFAATLAASVTGLALYFLPGRIATATWLSVHEWSGLSIPLYVVLHVAALIGVGGLGYLLKLFRPRPAYGAALVGALGAGAAVAAAFYGADRASVDTLSAARVTAAPALDGKAEEAIWSEAEPVEITTTRGANFEGGEATVRVRAAHDGEYFYAVFQWPDDTRSFKHLPLVKTEAGWKVQQTEYGIEDEDSYYEDKFGVMLSEGAGPAGDGSVHLGHQPLEGKPGPAGGRGLHYTTDGSIVDVWHWKAVRSGNPLMQQIDDNFFGPPMEPKGKGRYTAGYDKDPGENSGFSMNWEAYSDGIVTPKRLPKDPAMLARFQGVDLDADAGDAEPIFLAQADTVPYDPALDTYPVGTIMPSVLVDAPFKGDRGDVEAVATWQDGVWTLELRRKLDTGSKFDLPLAAGTPAYLWVAVFDHAQTRHSQQLRPVEIALR